MTLQPPDMSPASAVAIHPFLAIARAFSVVAGPLSAMARAFSVMVREGGPSTTRGMWFTKVDDDPPSQTIRDRGGISGTPR